MNRILRVGIVGFLAWAGALHAEPIYHLTPDWVSSDTPVSTGGALVDLDRDGWPDFIVANGNDISREQLVVYYNNGDGTLPLAPNWVSADAEFNGHLSVADVNGDGWLDVAVGLTMQDAGTATVRLYLNNAGTLSSLPDWESPDELAAFHVAFGDVNGDGRPDLAVANGWPYSGPHPWHNQVYLNVGGTLESSPSWVSDDTWDLGDAFFCDVNADGRLDLVGVGEGTDTWVYVNDNGALDTSASWHTTDNPGQFSVMGTYGDVDGDGWYELFTTDNTQLFAPGGGALWAALPAMGRAPNRSGSGNLRRYDGLPGGFFTTTPAWTYFEGYGSAVALGDLDADGDLDLLCGSWWGQTHYFLNTGGVFPAGPDWSSTGTSVVEAICLGDVNNDGLRVTLDSFDVTATPDRHLFPLVHQPIERIVEVSADDVSLQPHEFTFDLVHGWVSIGPAASTNVSIEYVYSVRLDMGVTNWDGNRGNYLYYNNNDVVLGDFDADGDVDLDDYDQFEACFTGPGGGPVTFPCTLGDFDGDGDIDCVDWRRFILYWTEPGDPPDLAACPEVFPPAVEPGGPACLVPADCTGAWAGAECAGGLCYVPKNRYLSIDPTVNAVAVAFQVELAESADYPTAVGRTWWLSEPGCFDWQGFVADPPPNPQCAGADFVGWVSTLSPIPVTREWTESPLHIGDCGIVPAVVYQIRASLDEGQTFSEPLDLPTAADPAGDAQSWGDQTGGPVAAMPGQWLPPEGSTNFGDIQASIRCFERKLDPTGFAPRVWMDVDANRTINFNDIQLTVLAFEGRAYTWPENNVHPAECP